MGKGALGSNTTASYNVAVGYYALNANTTGQYNIAVGHGALDSNTDGGTNIAIGYNALTANTSGIRNNALGHGALGSNTTGNRITIGSEGSSGIAIADKKPFEASAQGGLCILNGPVQIGVTKLQDPPLGALYVSDTVPTSGPVALAAIYVDHKTPYK